VGKGRTHDGWKYNVVLLVFKGIGDPCKYGSYRAVMLLEHVMKLIELVFERRIRQR